ncbi:MAG: alpha/beta hydrolase [Gemmatimonadetes bacterium]|nr:alpha/beta hydrolase [Gemmatimonadota bacterium]
MRTWLKRIGLGLLGLIVVAALLGAIAERVARGRAATDHPPPGRLVDIGGRRLHLDCRGSGTPIVVLEAGLDMNGSLAWAAVHDSIAATTRTCGYSRAGIMWSDPGPQPRHATAVAADLDAALTAAGEAGPYVMVGHSLGGPYISVYTKRFPDKVAGLVFVDASHPDQVARLAEATGKEMEPPLGSLKVLAALAWTGLARAVMPTDTNGAIPESVRRATAAYAATSMGPMIAEARAMSETMAQAGEARALGERPLAVLTAAAPLDAATLAQIEMTAEQGRKFQAIWTALQVEQAGWSSRSEHQIIPDASHYVQRDRPDLVIAAVRRVVEQVRAGR